MFFEIILQELFDLVPVRISVLVHATLVLKTPVLNLFFYLFFQKYNVHILVDDGVFYDGNMHFGQTHLQLVEMRLLNVWQ